VIYQLEKQLGGSHGLELYQRKANKKVKRFSRKQTKYLWNNHTAFRCRKRWVVLMCYWTSLYYPY